MVGKMNMPVQRGKIQYKRHEFTALMDVSPERKRAVMAFYKAKEAMTAIAMGVDWEACVRSLRIYALPTQGVRPLHQGHTGVEVGRRRSRPSRVQRHCSAGGQGSLMWTGPNATRSST